MLLAFSACPLVWGWYLGSSALQLCEVLPEIADKTGISARDDNAREFMQLGIRLQGYRGDALGSQALYTGCHPVGLLARASMKVIMVSSPP